MKAKEIKAMTPEQRKAKLKEIDMELLKLRAQVATGTTPKNPGQIKMFKRLIARIHTINNLEVQSKHARN